MTDSILDRQPDSLYWEPETISKDRTLYNWPPKPLQTLKWFKDYLFSPIQLFFALLGLFVWFFLTPSMTTMKTFSWDWILIIYFRNVALLSLITGTVHFWLYIKKGQGSQFQYNNKGLRKNDSRFWFNDQTKENMFFSIVSGCGIWTLYEAFTYWMFANDYLLFPVEWFDSSIYIVILVIFIPHINAHHFYFTHRLTHWKPLYDSAHYLHHKNINVGPWSGLSMHPVEHLIYLSGVLIYWIIPSHPFHACYLLLNLGIGPIFGHTGYHKIVVNQKTTTERGKAITEGDYFHYLHHKYFECNYGLPAVPWDYFFGTFHDGSIESKKMLTQRMKQRSKKIKDLPF